MASERKVEGAIRYLVTSKDLQLESMRVLHEVLLVTILLCGNEIINNMHIKGEV